MMMEKNENRVMKKNDEENENSNECETCFSKVLYIGLASKQFTKSLSELVYREFGLKLRAVLQYIQDQSLLSAKNKNTACFLLQCCVPVSMFV